MSRHDTSGEWPYRETVEALQRRDRRRELLHTGAAAGALISIVFGMAPAIQLIAAATGAA